MTFIKNNKLKYGIFVLFLLITFLALFHADLIKLIFCYKDPLLSLICLKKNHDLYLGGALNEWETKLGPPISIDDISYWPNHGIAVSSRGKHVMSIILPMKNEIFINNIQLHFNDLLMINVNDKALKIDELFKFYRYKSISDSKGNVISLKYHTGIISYYFPTVFIILNDQKEINYLRVCSPASNL